MTTGENLRSTNGFGMVDVYLSGDRCQTEWVSGDKRWTRAMLEAAIARAAKEGHDLEVDLQRVKITKTGYGYAVRCSCGWQSTPKTKPVRAFYAGTVHVGEVLGESFYDEWAGGVGASPDVPERSTDPTKEGPVSGEGEPSSPAVPGTRATVAAR